MSVMHGTGCNSDHQLIRAKFVVGRKRYLRRNQSKVNVKRWDVSNLQGECTDDQGEFV